ncbi:hypothetical protein ACIRD2_03100 [Streptomyces sp. NPDC093595]|jgi:hypothetical protein|uniref:hypothetical protein n=1 Tax=Streptomyces sp. NPDC093595 TaxID=3366045 RepID=UPI00382C8F28
MRTRVIAVLAAAAFTALVGCSPEEDTDRPTASASTAGSGKTGGAAGIPPEPTGELRQRYLESLATINPALVADEDKAIDAGRNQCSSIRGGAKDIEGSAQQRFSNSGHQVTEAEAKSIVIVLKSTLCP